MHKETFIFPYITTADGRMHNLSVETDGFHLPITPLAQVMGLSLPNQKAAINKRFTTQKYLPLNSKWNVLCLEACDFKLWLESIVHNRCKDPELVKHFKNNFMEAFETKSQVAAIINAEVQKPQPKVIDLDRKPLDRDEKIIKALAAHGASPLVCAYIRRTGDITMIEAYKPIPGGMFGKKADRLVEKTVIPMVSKPYMVQGAGGVGDWIIKPGETDEQLSQYAGISYNTKRKEGVGHVLEQSDKIPEADKEVRLGREYIMLPIKGKAGMHKILGLRKEVTFKLSELKKDPTLLNQPIVKKVPENLFNEAVARGYWKDAD